MDKRRGFILTLILFFLVFLYVLAIIGAFALHIDKELDLSTTYYVIAVALIDIALVIGIWRWKKIAVYLYFMVVMLSLIIGFARDFQLAPFEGFNWLWPLILNISFFVFLREKWKYFK